CPPTGVETPSALNRRGGEDLLYRNFRLPDERARLGESGRGAPGARLPTGGFGRRSGLRALQHLQHSRKGGAKSLLAPGGDSERAALESSRDRRARLRGA